MKCIDQKYFYFDLENNDDDQSATEMKVFCPENVRSEWECQEVLLCNRSDMSHSIIILYSPAFINQWLNSCKVLSRFRELGSFGRWCKLTILERESTMNKIFPLSGKCLLNFPREIEDLDLWKINIFLWLKVVDSWVAKLYFVATIF